MYQNDIISAIATAPGEGGIGIVRISGAGCAELAEAMFRAASGRKLKDYRSHQAVYGRVLDVNDKVIDEAICLIMRAPHSYTCEDVIELQCHGGAMALREVLRRSYQLGARPAEPGEFTKRAFLNGRLDLSQAQAVMDVIKARTRDSLRVAAGHLNGDFSNRIQDMRHIILGMIAHLEASIDFPEDDIEDVAIEGARLSIEKLMQKIDKLLSSADTGRILREGLKTAIIGRPNAGKSSIMNMLLKEQRAIVTDIPGTTRDSIEEYANIGGIPLVLTDTAGIRETEDTVEKIGVDRARKCLESAALILAVLDGSRELSEDDKEVLNLLKDRKVIVLINKNDIGTVLTAEGIADELSGLGIDINIRDIISISAETGDGLELLESSIRDIVFAGNVRADEEVFVSNEGQARLLGQSLEYLGNAMKSIDAGMSEDFIVIDLRSAWEALGRITGETVEEDIIDRIFSEFCIGK